MAAFPPAPWYALTHYTTTNKFQYGRFVSLWPLPDADTAQLAVTRAHH